MHQLSSHPPRWVRLCVVIGTAALAQNALAAPLDLYWPQFRHDPAHTNFSPGKGHLDAPTVKWRLPLGGRTVAARMFDVDLDGVDDVVSIEGGRVTARGAKGQVLWGSAQLAATAIAGIGDVDGDGTADVAVAAANRAHIVRASDGVVLWSSDIQTPALGYLALSDFDGDGILDAAIGASQGGTPVPQPVTHIFGFVGGAKLLATTAQAATSEDKPFIDSQCPLDIDGDGLLDFLLPGGTHFYAYSGKTGQLLGQSPAFTTIGQQPQSCGSFRPDAAKAPIVLYAGDLALASYLWHGVAALQLQDGALKLLWSNLLPELATQHFVTVPGSIADLDGDGVGEVIAAVFDKGVWQLEARDAATGAVLQTLSAAQMPGVATGGPYLRGIARMTADAHASLVVQRVDAGAAPAMGPLTLWQWTRKGGFVQYADLGVGGLSTANWHTANGAALVANADPLATLRPWGDLQAPHRDLLILRDTDGDNAVDSVDNLRIGDAGEITSVGKLPLPRGAQLLGMAATGAGQANALVRSLVDGTVGFFPAPTGAPANDANGDGLGDLRFGGVVSAYLAIAPATDAEKRGRILVSVGDSAHLLDTTAAGPMNAPTVALDLALPTLAPRANFADVNGDGQRDIVVRSVSKNQVVSLAAFALSGAPMWTYTHPDGPWAWGGTEGDPFVIADVNGDGAEDLICEWDLLGATGQNKFMTVISGKTGADLWPTDAKCRLGATAFSLDLLAAPMRIVSSVYNYRYTCDAATGKITEEFIGKEPRYGVSMLTDLDGDGAQEHVLCGSSEGLAAEKTVGFQTLWQAPIPGSYHASGALVLVGAQPLAAHASLTQPTVHVVAAKTGAAVWNSGYLGGQQVAVDVAAKSGFASAGLLAAADLTGAGHPSLLFRTTEGYLYCVNALTGAIDWSLNWGGAFADPVVADIDGDGELELLAVASDGALYAFDHSNVPAVAWVRENVGNGPALDDAADIDTQEDARTLHVNWAPEAGAEGYAVSVLDQNGATILPAQSYGAGAQATLTGLTMHLGQHYQVAVQAYSAAGPNQAFAPTTLSDGVTIVDASPPWIDGQQLVPFAVQAGQPVKILADLHDKTLVRDWRVQITPVGGTTPLWQKRGNTAQPDVHLNETWLTATDAGQPLPPDDYVVHVEVRDGAQHAAAVDMTLHVCGAPPFSATACNAGDLTGQDASGSGGDVDSLPQRENEGCGCRVAGTHNSIPVGGVWFLAACLWLIRRSRTARPS